jgi:hypothetical protein
MPVALSRAGWVATASSTFQSDVPGNALDGNRDTRWSSGIPQSPSAGQWFQIDMRAPMTFTQLTIDAGSSTGDQPRAYQVFASNDPTDWGTAIASGNGAAQVVSITFPFKNARYIKIIQNGSALNWWSIHELNVYGMAPSILPRAGWVAKASSTSGGDVASRAIDGNITTRWSTGVRQTNGQWFQVDMGASQIFSQITLDAGTSVGDHPRAYEVFASDDPALWGPPIAKGTGSSAIVIIAFAPKTARFIRIVQTGSSGSNWWSIHEFNVAYVTSIVPSVSGITTLNGRTVAIFSYENVAGENINIPHGVANDLRTTRGSDDKLSALPPVWFTPGIHTGVFTASLDADEELTWMVAGLAVTADFDTNSLTLVTRPEGQGVLIDGVFTVLSKDPIFAFKDAVVTPDNVDGLTPGALDGHLDVSADGAATYHVPIWTPGAPVKPSLSFDYHSRSGSSYLGVGFRIGGLSSIARCKTAFAQELALERRSINLNKSDHLCLDGKLLIPVHGDDWTDNTEYRPDGDPYTFIKEHNDSPEGAYSFEVRRHDGLIETYGGATDAFLVGAGASPADGSARVEWALKTVSDRSGNLATYTYSTVAHGGLALIPRRINYGNAGATNAASYEILFDVEPMPRSESLFEAGFEFPLTDRLTDISISGPSPVASFTIKRYHVAYNEAPSVSTRFVVASLQECDGPAVAATVCQSPTIFTWEPGLLQFEESDDITFNEVHKLFGDAFPAPIPYYAMASADFDGDGKDDIVYRGIDPGCPGAHAGVPFNSTEPHCKEVSLYYRLSAEGFGTAHPMAGTTVDTEAQTSFHLEPSPIMRNFMVADVDGDGSRWKDV